MHFALIVITCLSLEPTTASWQSAQPHRSETTSEPDAAYYFLLGRYLEGEGKVSEAIDALKHAIELEPGTAEPRAELAALYARQDRPQDAITAAEEALKIDATNREANRVLGSVLAALSEQRQPLRSAAQVAQDQNRAIAALETARGTAVPDLSLDLTLARLYLARNRAADAVPLLRRIIDEQPTYGDGWLLLASALEASGHAGEAAETLTTAVRDQPTLFRARVQLAELYERQRQWAQAADAWAQIQTLSPRNADIIARRATALINAGQPQAARDLVSEGLKAQPRDARLAYMLAQVQRDLGELNAAEATARQLREDHPEDVRGAYMLAQVLQARGRSREVVDLLQADIARLRKSGDSGGQLAVLLDTQGLALQQLRRHDEAIDAFKEAVDRAPNDPIRHALLIQGLSAANRHVEAVASAESARTKFPDDTGVLYQAGAAFDKAGRPADAERTFRDLIARDPQDANALNYLGYMFAERGTQLDEAVTLIERALKVDPENAAFLDSLGWAYVQQGKLELADQPLTTAAGKMPKNSVIQDHLGDLRIKQNRHADAIAAWQRALEGDGDSIDPAKIQKKIAEAKRSKK